HLFGPGWYFFPARTPHRFVLPAVIFLFTLIIFVIFIIHIIRLGVFSTHDTTLIVAVVFVFIFTTLLSISALYISINLNIGPVR
ncbi:hypothetical protein IL306_014097, partial [Fusarium sp. DS 682]